MNAALNGSTEGTRLLLSQPHVKEQLEVRGPGGVNALMTAYYRGHAGVMRLLLGACGGTMAAAQCRDVDG